MRILYVENHSRLARIVAAQYLSEHRVIVVPSLAEAREQLAETGRADDPFAVVLLDYDLDDGKGDSLLPDLVKIMPRLRVVAVSSHQKGNEVLLQAGADAVCPKMELHTVATFLSELV